MTSAVLFPLPSHAALPTGLALWRSGFARFLDQILDSPRRRLAYGRGHVTVTGRRKGARRNVTFSTQVLTLTLQPHTNTHTGTFCVALARPLSGRSAKGTQSFGGSYDLDADGHAPTSTMQLVLQTIANASGKDVFRAALARMSIGA